MEYAKDEILKITYNSQINKLQTPKENWKSKIIKKIKKHKWISLAVSLLIIFSGINFLLIYYFMDIYAKMC